MNRPNIKDFFSDDITPKMINNMFLENKELYNYIQALDNYIDELESRFVENRVMQKIAEEEIKQKLLWLDNLLCTIHRDGGSFIEENGYQKAYDKAMDKIISWLPIS